MPTRASPAASSLTNDNTPVVSGTGLTAENGSSVYIYTDPGCTAPTLVGSATIGSGVFDITNISFATDGSEDATIDFYGQIVDQALNASACTDVSLGYTLDTVAPTVTGLTNDPTPTKSKAWTWSCSETCNFRYVVDTSATTTPTGA